MFHLESGGGEDSSSQVNSSNVDSSGENNDTASNTAKKIITASRNNIHSIQCTTDRSENIDICITQINLEKDCETFL